MTGSSASTPRAGRAQSAADSLCTGPLTGGTVFYVPPREGFSLSAPISAEARRFRGRVAVLERHHPGSAAVDAARLALKAQRARDYLLTLLSSPPHLTSDQRLELVGMLSTPEDGDHDAAA